MQWHGDALVFDCDMAKQLFESSVYALHAGVRAAGDAAFVLVAGGLGERLGYSGIKLALPSDTARGACFLQVRLCSNPGFRSASTPAASKLVLPCGIANAAASCRSAPQGKIDAVEPGTPMAPIPAEPAAELVAPQGRVIATALARTPERVGREGEYRVGVLIRSCMWRTSWRWRRRQRRRGVARGAPSRSPS